jgi:hypothetical protein
LRFILISLGSPIGYVILGEPCSMSLRHVIEVRFG